MSVAEWDEVITTDLSSAFYCTSAAVPHMVERNYGRIIVMSSIIGQMGNLGQSNYAAAKAGLIAFAKSAAKELARNNITVNAMCPGFVETDMVIALTDDVKKNLLANIPLGRFGKPGGGRELRALPRHGGRLDHRPAVQPQRRPVHVAAVRHQLSVVSAPPSGGVLGSRSLRCLSLGCRAVRRSEKAK